MEYDQGIVRRRKIISPSFSAFSNPAAVAAPPTVLHLTAPNNFQDASWSQNLNASCAVNNVTDPLGGSTASQIVCTTGGGFAAMRATIPITMASSTNYSLTGYVFSLIAPVWMSLLLADDIATGTNFVQCWMNTSTGTPGSGTNSEGGGGHIDTGPTITVDSNGFFKVVFNFHFTTTPVSTNFVDIRFVNVDGGSTATLSQAYTVWGWGL